MPGTGHYACTDGGKVAIWLNDPPTFTSFRPADAYMLVGRGDCRTEIIHASTRILLGGGAVSLGKYSKKYASAAWRARAGRSPWEGVHEPQAKPWLFEAYAGRRMRDAALEMLTADEILRARELEAASDRTLGELLADARERGVDPFDREGLDRVRAIEDAIHRIVMGAFDRKHPPARTDTDLSDRLRRLMRGTDDLAPFVALGIDATSDVDVIRAAWRRKALELHPDRGGDPAAFRAAKAAYDKLIDRGAR